MKLLEAKLTMLQRRWIGTVLANDEASTDAELIEYFVENLVDRATAEYIVTNLRTPYLNGWPLIT